MNDKHALCLSGKGLTKIFGIGDTKTVAVDHVDFEFHEGEIIQIGIHEELLADRRGKYYELWNAQAQYYTT